MSIHAITVPKWGIEMQEGTITDWHLEVGANVDKGAELVDIETEKIVNTLEAPASGTLARIIGEVGQTLVVGQLLGVITEADASEEQVDQFIRDFIPVDASFAEGEVTETAEAPAAETESEVRISPVARRLAERLGVDVSAIQGTGRNGRISKQDVEAAAAAAGQGEGEGAGDGEWEESDFESIPLTSRRQTIARRLEQTTAIPTFDLTRDLMVQGTSGLTARLLAAVAKALVQVPALNVQVFEDRIHRFHKADINVAVDTPEGLVAPLMAGVDQQSAESIASQLKSLAQSARDQSLSAEQIQPGGFTVSNLGALGVDGFRAVINPPQGAILAVGRLREDRMMVTLSCDHRAIDGADGARFLQALQEALEEGDG